MTGIPPHMRNERDDGPMRTWKVMLKSGKAYKVRAASEYAARQSVEQMFGGRDNKRGRAPHDPADVAHPSVDGD